MFRYPGVKPFEKTDQPLFFGRSEDINDLYELILLEKIVVFFGKSGYGKSSLLNAGIIPRFLEEDGEDQRYQPISIRFGAYQKESSISPLEKLLAILKDQLPVAPGSEFLTESDSLWYQFKRRQSGAGRHFLLVFDQFEEFFTYPIGEQVQFQKELAELLYKGIPQRIRDNLEQYKVEERSILARKMEVKIVFAIRSDRMSELDKLRNQLPAVLNKRYELDGLTNRQAREAIVMPALLAENEHVDFASPQFSFDESAVDMIIRELSSAETKEEGVIEAFQLQILCQYIESQVNAGNIAAKDEEEWPVVFPEDLPDISNIYETYYRKQLSKLSETEQEAAREIIEYGLLYDNAQKGEARRLSVDGDVLVQRFRGQGANYGLLEKLENTFLLRREVNSLGGYNYELCHDTLIPPVLKSKRERAVERKRIAAEKQAEQEAIKRRAVEEAERRKEAEKLRALAEKGRRRAALFARFSFALLLLSIVLSLYAFNERTKVLVERKAKNRLNFEILHQRAVVILGAGGCPMEIYKEMEDIEKENKDNTDMRTRLEQVTAEMFALKCF